MAQQSGRHTLASNTELSRYIRRIQKEPLLTAEQEHSLARRWIEHGDIGASDDLVNSHLRLVVKFAMGYRGYGLPIEDLISQGNLGLMQAVQRFDPERGFRLSTYAMWWIRAAIQEYIIHSWSMVKMGTTADQKKLFFNLRRLKSQIGTLDEGDLTQENVRHIALALNVPEMTVTDMNRRLAGADRSLNAPMQENGETQWQDWLVDDEETQEAKLAAREENVYRRQLLAGAMKHLTEREREIVAQRHLVEVPETLEVLGQRYGVSRERVRQIEAGAIGKLKGTVARSVDEYEAPLLGSGPETCPSKQARAA